MPRGIRPFGELVAFAVVVAWSLWIATASLLVGVLFFLLLMGFTELVRAAGRRRRDVEHGGRGRPRRRRGRRR